VTAVRQAIRPHSQTAEVNRQLILTLPKWQDCYKFKEVSDVKRLEIAVPDYNDSFSKVALDGTEYLLRFTWNDVSMRWYFGVYTVLREPIVQGLKLVPQYPLNLQYIDERLPPGIFGVYSKLSAIGRSDFLDGKAIFAYIPSSEVTE
jgi:hypothetical protein